MFVTPSSGRPLRYLLKVTNINVLQLRTVTNIFKILKIQKDEMHLVLNIVAKL